MRSSDSGSDFDTAAVAALTKEVQATKQLLVLLLAKLGSDSKEIAMALGIDASTVRRMISFRKVAKIDRR